MMNWKDVEGNDRSLMEVTSLYLPGATEKNQVLCYSHFTHLIRRRKSSLRRLR
jgi:hypothetical protein